MQSATFQSEKIITLRKPITFGDVTYNTIDLCEPTAGQLDKATRAPSDVAVAITLISLVAKIPVRAIEGLCQRDFQECSDFLAIFGPAGATTGETGLQD